MSIIIIWILVWLELIDSCFRDELFLIAITGGVWEDKIKGCVFLD